MQIDDIRFMNTTIHEIEIKVTKLHDQMRVQGVESLILRSVAAHLYLTGSVIHGYTYIHKDEPLPLFFLEKPTHALEGFSEEKIFSVRKPELIPDILAKVGHKVDEKTALELSHLPVSEYERLRKLSDSGKVSSADGSTILREARSIKTENELTEMRRLALLHMEIYRLVPELYTPGMSDLELQHLLEYQMRRRGSIGLFRAFGPRMEIFMGSVLAGENAVNPAPYDFTMGGKGLNALPMGATGIEIMPGTTVMVDMAGNYGVLQTDITRTYYLGELPDEVVRAHNLSIEMQEWFMQYAREGAEISTVYNHFLQRAQEEGFAEQFMGFEHQVKFVGHGVGVEVNELPILTPRYPGKFRSGMTIAVEPKFVFPEVGAVGMENTYIIGREGAENITPLPMELIPLVEEKVRD